MFRSGLDERCQRGLHWRYAIDPGWLPSVEARAELHGSLGHDPVVRHRVEGWGTQQVHIFARPFRYEIRAWTRPGELSLIHRASASSADRRQDRAHLERHLTLWLQTCRS